MIAIAANIEFDEVTLKNIKKAISHYGNISEDVWEPVKHFVMDLARKRAVKIVRYSVKKSTKAWRKWASGSGYQVKTIRNEKTNVLDSPRVGRRTGTFTKALRTSDPSVVSMTVATGSNTLTNGEFIYTFDSSAFYNSYPTEYFEPYLISRGIVPPDGIMGLSEEDERTVLSKLMEDVYTNVAKNMGFM